MQSFNLGIERMQRAGIFCKKLLLRKCRYFMNGARSTWKKTFWKKVSLFMIKRNLYDKTFFSCLTHLKSWMLELERNEFEYKVLMSFQLILFTEEGEEEVGLFHPTLIFRDKSNFRLPISFMWLLGGLWVWETWLVILLLLPTILRKEINSGSTYHHTGRSFIICTSAKETIWQFSTLL